jgi:transcriptional regulator GlxA family with amidase domain
MRIAAVLYPRFTALDIVGPYDVLCRLPGAEWTFVAEQRGEIRTDTGRLGMTADASLDEYGQPDIVIVPGGAHDAQLENRVLLDWLAQVHEGTSTTASVCTGSVILAAAGILDGLPAVTHWLSMDQLGSFGAVPTPERVVRSGKVITAAGVSAGIDMALRLAADLAGDEFAQGIQLGIEYDPQPPFDAGSPDKAPAPIVELLRALGPSITG